MTLDEAIAHAGEAGRRTLGECSANTCGLEHIQLRDWLSGLKEFRRKYGKCLDEQVQGA